MAELYGWVGKILRVDLTKGEITTVPTTNYVPKFIGGRGLGAKIYWDEVSPEVRAFDPGNKLIFATGPVTGTSIPTSGRTILVGKSPQAYPVEHYWYSSAGGHWGPELKFAGYDAIIIQGKADEPVYLWIHNGEAEIRPAKDLWGLNTYATQDELRRRHGDKTKSLVIGVAGENMSRIATIISDAGSAFGQGGFGGVMGSKNLKAIAIRGTNSIQVANPREVLEVSYYTSRILTRKEGEREPPNPARQQWCLFSVYGIPDGIKGTEIYDEAKKGRVRIGFGACYACPIACRITIKFKDGQISSTTDQCTCVLNWLDAPKEYYKEGKKFNIASVAATALIDLYGINAWEVKESHCKALINAGFLDGEGFGSIEWIQEFLYKIANRVGFGDLWAEGLARMCNKLGGEALKYYQKKYPAGGKFGGIEYSIWNTLRSILAAPHTRQYINASYSVFHPYLTHLREYFTNPEECKRVIKAAAEKWWGSEEVADPYSWNWKYLVPVAKYYSRFWMINDSLLICEWVFPRTFCEYTSDKLGTQRDMALPAEFYSYVTGIDTTMEELLKAGERILNLERAIHVREGRRREDDCYNDTYIADREWFDREKWRETMDEYYKALGWDLETGIPRRGKLEELGLKDIADDLEEKYGVPVPP